MFRLGHSIWSLSFRRRGVLIYAFCYTFFSCEFDPYPLFLQSSLNHPYHPSQPRPQLFLRSAGWFLNNLTLWHTKVLNLNTSQRHKMNTSCVFECLSLYCCQNMSLMSEMACIKNAIYEKDNRDINYVAVVFTYILLSVCILPVVRHGRPPHQSLKIQEPRLGQTRWQWAWPPSWSNQQEKWQQNNVFIVKTA